jgi:hypothetical protein
MTRPPLLEPTPERVAAWLGLAELFVGRELDPADIQLIARQLRSTKLPMAELERILCDEVEPVFGGNIGLLNPTPELEGWSSQGIEDAVRKYLERPHRAWTKGVLRRLTPRAARQIPWDRWTQVRAAVNAVDGADEAS